MRQDSPVLILLEENPNIDLVKCRWCGEEGHQMQWRWYKWGANGFCSKSCFDAANKAYNNGDKSWYKLYHPKFLVEREESK